MRFPDDKTYSRGVNIYKARKGHKRAVDLYGENSLPARAWYGRLLYFFGMIPQKFSSSVESVAWHRAAGTNPGLANRTQRKKRSSWV